METVVLCPADLCLRAAAPGPHPSAPGPHPGRDLSVWTAAEVEKGTTFLPWKGSVKAEVLPPFLRLPEYDLRHRFGLHDEVRAEGGGPLVRHCNWVRFLRYTLLLTPEVNVVGSKTAAGEPVFEVLRFLPPGTELLAFLRPDSASDLLLLPAIQFLRQTLFKTYIENVLADSPLDLSSSLITRQGLLYLKTSFLD